jgi:hypothetical protein
MIRGDLQEAHNAQDVYAATLSFKIHRMLMVLTAADDLKTPRLDEVNAFLNAKNDEMIFCHMLNGFRSGSPRKRYRVLKALYDQR